jgi:predicted Zn-dependent protease
MRAKGTRPTINILKTGGMLAALLTIFVFASGFDFGKFMGDTLTQQEYNKTYNEEYKKAKQQGMTDEEADRNAKEKAEASAARRRELIEGIGAVASSQGGIDYETEMTIGESLALEAFKRYGPPVNDDSLQNYVNVLGNAVARNSLRPDISYRFVVIDSPLYNAFACPGGIIFVSSTLVKSLKDESELAAILAHEVAHVSHKHALRAIQRAKFFEGVGKITASTMKGENGKKFKNMIGDLQTVLFDKGLDKEMEFEADLSGMRAAYRTGYDPGSMIEVLKMLQRNERGATKAGSWYSTHPPLSERVSRTSAEMRQYPDAAQMATVQGRFASFQKSIR